MPNIEEITCSDDEYQDANCEIESLARSAKEEQKHQDSVKASVSESHNDDINEIIEKCNNVKISDEGNCSGEKGDGSTEAYYVDEYIDENALLERDKSLTEVELENNKQNAESIKLKANHSFKDNKPLDAVELYTEALKICPIKYEKERAILYSNRGAAKIKLGSKKAAIDDCSKAIELWPDYVRALLRRAKLYELDDKLDEALKDYQRVVELDVANHEAREALMRLPPLIEERNERLKTEMLEKLKDLGNMILKPFGLSTDNFQMQKDPATGSYSINFNQNQNSS